MANYEAMKKEIVEKRQDFIDGKSFPLDNVRVEYCHLVEPDVAFGKSEWNANIILEEPLALSLAAVGFNVKKREDGKYFIASNSKTQTKKGPNSPPRVYGPDAKPFDGSLVGNGTLANVKVYARYCEVNGVWHLPLRLSSLQVVDLVERASDFEPVDQGTGGTDGPGDDVPF